MAIEVRAAACLLLAASCAASLAGADSWLERHACLHGRLGWTDFEADSGAAPFDEKTGRDNRNYPPSPLADHQRMVLDIDIPDMNRRFFNATQTLTFTALGKPLDALTLNAEGLAIDSVTMNERAIDFSHDGSTLTVRFDPPLQPGQTATINTRYSAEDPADGMVWSPEDPAIPGRAAQLHTQGQPESNRFWFPSHDFPNERMSTEIMVTVPDGYLASANGRLAAESVDNGRRTFHWVQDKPHPAYLVSLIVGQFDVVDVADSTSRVPMPCYVAPGDGDKVERTFGRTRDMMKVFEERFDEPFAWDRYAQLLVWNYGSGGMENTSATTLYEWCILDEHAEADGDMDGLIAHELGHQWFGDLLTCKSWAHLWLNEGFATYTESLWYEKRDGFDGGYLDDIWSNMRGLAASDRLDPKDENAWDRPGMVSNVYDDPGDTFGRRSNPYPKGASILHMLRVMLGDDVFFKGLQTYVDRFALKEVETTDFRRVLEEVSGRSLEQFFDQWAIRPGTPQVTMTAKWSEKDATLNITIEQTQRIDVRTPAFVFDLPIHIETAQGPQTITIPVNERRHERAVTLESEPTFVAIDPGLAVLMTPTAKVPAGWLRAQAEQGPTLPSRLDAARALRERPGAETVATLNAIVRDSSEHHHTRRIAADSLGALRQSETLVDVLRSGVDDARVRSAVVAALASSGDKQAALPIMVEIAGDTAESYAVRAEAVEALGSLGDESHLPLINAALATPSQSDVIQRAALTALRRLDLAEGLDGAITLCAPSSALRTRASAISTVADLSDHDPEKAFDAIEPLLWSNVERIRTSAGSALARIDDERGLTSLRNAAETHAMPSFRDSCRAWADRLAGRLSGDDLDGVQEELGRLQRELQDLKNQLDKLDKEGKAE
jgi:aminopeptidase N